MDVLQRFLAVAEANPDHAAVCHGDVTVSYGTMADRVCRLAERLSESPSPRVLIYLPQGAEAYQAMFATLMAGGYYAPVNLSAPVRRQRQVIDQFQPTVVLTSAAAMEQGGAELEDMVQARIITVENVMDEPLQRSLPPHDLAYVIFTSGSTGIPKGVMVGRDGLAHYTDWAIRAMNVTPDDKWSQFPPISFDLSVLDIYGALCAGATLYPFTGKADRLMPARAIKRHGLTIWNSVPSVVGLMMQAGQVTADHFATVRLATFCGEPLLPEHLDALFAAKPDLVAHNTYGPTEATVSFTLIRLNQKNYRDHSAASVALGDPIDGMGFSLVGGDTDDEGEIVITGPQVARGYWLNDEATDKVFKTWEGQPAYFTGDWAERRGEDVFFMARRDLQVKVRGYRVELEDVNAAVRAETGRAACALVDGDVIHCFLEGDAPVSGQAVTAVLSRHLESYAVPSFYYPVDQLPRNDNDKIDMRALAERLAEMKGDHD